MASISRIEEPRYLKAEIKSHVPEDDEDWDLDSMPIWQDNMLQSHLWRKWESELEPMGFNWQKFQKLISLCTDSFKLWIERKRDWQDVIKEIERTIDEESGLLRQL